jgi:hypothetical protein
VKRTRSEAHASTVTEASFENFLHSSLTQPVAAAAGFIGDRLAERFPGAAILIYGSGISVSAGEDPTAIMFDYYVIVSSYQSAFSNPLERFGAYALPPNVYYFETPSPMGVLRAKYAVLSADHFETLVSKRTFHSYFWARFAQPIRIVAAPAAMERRVISGVGAAAKTFLERAASLVDPNAGWRDIWVAGMNASYRAELRAESKGRAEKLIDNYGSWPSRLTGFALDGSQRRQKNAEFFWRLRAIQGGFLSIARLLKATATFDGGIDYIAWKIHRHTGIDLKIRQWERRLPIIAAPIVALRYYRLRSDVGRGE